MLSIEDVDGIISQKCRAPSPYWGWHDDHRHLDGTADYLPALQQVRSEFAALLEEINKRPRISALQLGLGAGGASHSVWGAIFDHIVTIDLGGMWFDDMEPLPGASTHDPRALDFANSLAPFDFLFIDAGHDEADCRQDHQDYGPLVRPGGLIAFHDALPRKGFEEVGVWRYLAVLPGVTTVGEEVGTAWIVKT